MVASGSAGETASLRGFQRLAVIDEEYPAVIPAVDDEVTGILYRDLSAADLQRLDEFEGEYYQRLTVPVVTDLGKTEAEVYVFKPHYRHLLTGTAWDVEAFRVRGIQRFLQDYSGFC